MDFTGERFVPGKGDCRIAVEHLARYHACVELARGRRVLDAACGLGYGTALLAQNAVHSTGVDISAEAITAAQSSNNGSGVEYVVGSVTKMPFADDAFDMVVSFETIEHISSDAQSAFLAEINRVLTPDGLLVMSTLNKSLATHENPFHELELDEAAFLGLIGAQFDTVDLYYQNVWDYAEIMKAAPSSKATPAVRMGARPASGLFLLVVAANAQVLPSIDSLFRSASCLNTDVSAQYEQSLSWRMTRPLRTLRALFRTATTQRH